MRATTELALSRHLTTSHAYLIFTYYIEDILDEVIRSRYYTTETDLYRHLQHYGGIMSLLEYYLRSSVTNAIEAHAITSYILIFTIYSLFDYAVFVPLASMLFLAIRHTILRYLCLRHD